MKNIVGIVTLNGCFKVTFFCVCAGEFRYYNYTETSAGVVMPVQEVVIHLFMDMNSQGLQYVFAQKNVQLLNFVAQNVCQ